MIVGGNVCPCLYIKKSAKGVVYVVLYVDDNLMVGDMAAIDDAISALKRNGLVLKFMEGLQDYLSCKIKFSSDKNRAWLGQSHLIKNLEKKFGEHMQDIWSHKTPDTSNFFIIRPVINSEKISTEDQQEYWLGVSLLLYLVKHLCPILANMTRELSKANDD